MRWSEFESAAPSLAGLGRELLDATNFVMLGTLRRDGFPRITPLEYTFYDGDLVIGGMWQSRKLLDLGRDPRCVLHSATLNKDGTQGDFKLYCRAIDQPPGTEYRARWSEWVKGHTGSPPAEPYHLFALDVTEAGFVVFGAPAGLFAERLRQDPAVRVRILGGPEKSAHLVAHWKAPGQ